MIHLRSNPRLLVTVTDDVVPQLVDCRVEREVSVSIGENGLRGGAVCYRTGRDPILDSRVGKRPDCSVGSARSVDAHADPPPVLETRRRLWGSLRLSFGQRESPLSGSSVSTEIRWLGSCTAPTAVA